MIEGSRKPVDIETATRRMGEPSWLMLGVMCRQPSEEIPTIEVMRRVAEAYKQSNYPIQEILPSTVHYAVDRMLKDGVLTHTRPDFVEIPGPHGTTHREYRPLYTVTPLGQEMWQRRLALIQALNPGSNT